MMKVWPEDQTELVSVEELIDPLKTALHGLYHLAPKAAGASYKGYNIGEEDRPAVPDPAYLLSAEGIEIQRAKGCGTPVDTIIHTAILLGMEQGRRKHRRDIRPAVRKLKAIMSDTRDTRLYQALEGVLWFLTQEEKEG